MKRRPPQSRLPSGWMEKELERLRAVDYAASISREDLDEMDRLIDEHRAEEAAPKPKKPFINRTPAYRCESCQLCVRVGIRLVCQGTGNTVGKDDYPGRCNYTPIERPADA